MKVRGGSGNPDVLHQEVGISVQKFPGGRLQHRPPLLLLPSKDLQLGDLMSTGAVGLIKISKSIRYGYWRSFQVASVERYTDVVAMATAPSL
jgi:hypothetical protein